MRTSRFCIPTFLMVVATLVPACSKGPGTKLQGRWVGTAIDNIPPSQEAKANGWVKGTSFAFKSDKVTITIPGEEPRTGAYSIANANGNHVTLQIRRVNGESDEAALVLVDDQKLRWDIGNERSITLERDRSAHD